jgi:hypothetical protein
MRTHFLFLPILFYALVACGSGDAPSGGLTPEQNANLDKAAQTLDAERADLPKRGGAEKPAEAKTAPAMNKPAPKPAQ